jgi:hypothetical protein
MVISTVIATLFGALLGLRFKVLIAAPASLVAVVIAAVSGTVHGDGITWLVLTALAVVASLQVGYIVGCTLRVLLAGTRAGTKDGVALPTGAEVVELSLRRHGHCVEVISEEGIELSPNLGDRGGRRQRFERAV